MTNGGFHARPHLPDKKRFLFFGIFILAVIYVIPFLIFQTGWFGDDMIAVRYAKLNSGSGLSDVFTYKDATMRRYRPLTQAFILKSYERFELDPMPFRLLSYAMFFTAIFFACLLSIRLGMPVWAILLSLAFFCSHQIIVMPLFRNSRPEPLILAFGIIALYFFDVYAFPYTGRKARTRNKFFFALLTGTALFLCLLSGELGLCFLMIIPIWAVGRKILVGTCAPKLFIVLKGLASALPIPVIVSLAYLSLYYAVGAPFGEAGGRYEVGIGVQTSKNVIVAFLGLLSPISTPFFAKAYHQNFPLFIASGLILISVILSIISIIWIISRRYCEESFFSKKVFGISSLWLISALLCFFPFVLISHISEIYLYHAALFFSFALGNFLFFAIQKDGMIRNCTVIFVIFLLSLHLVSYTHKFVLIAYNAQRFRHLCNQIENKCLNFVDQNCVYLLEIDPPEFVYSQFYITLPNLFYYGPQRGYQVNWIENAQADQLAKLGVAVWVVNRLGEITPYSPG